MDTTAILAALAEAKVEGLAIIFAVTVMLYLLKGARFIREAR